MSVKRRVKITDYITRKAAKKAMCAMCQSGAKLSCGTLNKICTTMRIFDAIPSADVQPVVHGKWAHRKSKLWSRSGYTVCSTCGFEYSDSHYHEVEEFNYCPNCGADMREPQKEET